MLRYRRRQHTHIKYSQTHTQANTCFGWTEFPNRRMICVWVNNIIRHWYLNVNQQKKITLCLPNQLETSLDTHTHTKDQRNCVCVCVRVFAKSLLCPFHKKNIPLDTVIMIDLVQNVCKRNPRVLCIYDLCSSPKRFVMRQRQRIKCVRHVHLWYVRTYHSHARVHI